MSYVMTVYLDSIEPVARALFELQAEFDPDVSDMIHGSPGYDWHAPAPSMVKVLEGLLHRGSGATGKDTPFMIRTLHELYRRAGTRVGQLGPLGFDVKDLPELYGLQVGESLTSFDLGVEAETGVPSVARRRLEDVEFLLERVRAGSPATRPAHVREALGHLRTWLQAGVDAGQGLVCFFE